MMDGRVMVMDFNKKRPIGQGAVFVGQVKARSNAFSPYVHNTCTGVADEISKFNHNGHTDMKQHANQHR